MSPRTKNPWVSVGVALMMAISLNSMSYTWAQTSTSNTTVSSGSGEASSPDTFLQRPIDKAMDPLYKMTNYFLQLVKGNTGITEYVDELERSGLEVVKRDNQTDYFATLQSSAFMLRLSTEWGQTVQWFIAYTVCIAVGILFMIIMPIVGCCVCCCRCCCKKCGGKVDPMEPKNAKCRRVVFGLVLAVITTLMLGGMVCAFVTNELMQEQTNHNNNDTGLLNSISKEIGRIDDYLSNTLTEINTTVINSYNGAKGSVIRKIEDAADSALDKIGNATNASEVIVKAKELAKSVETLAANLETVKTNTEALSDLTIQLDGELAAVRQNISDTLSSCTVVAACNATGRQLDSLQTGANFTSLTTDALKTITDALKEVEKVQNNNISAKVEQGEQEYKNISVKAKEQLDNEINKTKVELKKLDEKLGATLVELSAQTKTFSGPVNNARNSITSASDAITLYGKYRWYAGIGLSCILLLIVLFNYLGLAFGACGEPPDDDAHMCNTGVGANLLLAGVGFTFIFCSLLMLITMILFLVGSVSHNWVCLPTDPTNPNAEGYKLADGILASNNINLSVSDGIKGCKKDKALYTAFQLDKLVPVDGLLAPVTAQIDDQMEKLKSIDLSSAIDQNITIIDSDLQQQMRQFANAGIANISFPEFFNQTDEALTAIDLDAFANNLTDLAGALAQNPYYLNETAEKLEGHAATLRSISANTVNNMSSTVRNLKHSLNVLNDSTNLQDQVNGLLNLSRNAESAIQTKGKEIIKKTINETADEVKEVLNEAINTAVKGLKEDVGKCGVLYSSLETLHGTVCKTVLYPFNGFWYSIGWCLFFFIPSIIFAMLLAGQYRKTEEYDPKRDDFDHSNYEEDYQGAFPGDHIALDYMSRRQGKQERNGVSNAGYDDRRGGGGGYPYNSGGGGGDRYDDNRYKGTPSGGYGRGYDGYHDNRSYGGGYGGRGSYDRSDSYVEPVAPPSYHAAAYGNHWQNNRHY